MKLSIKNILDSICLCRESPNYRKTYRSENLDAIFDIDSNKKLLIDLIRNNNIYVLEEIKINNTKLLVYKSKEETYYFVDKNIIALRLFVIEVKYENLSGVKIEGVKKHPSYKNLGQFIYTNYLLNKFDFIESDSTHNDGGKILWKKLLLWAVQNNKKAVVYSKDDGEFYQFFKTYEVNDNFDSFYPDSNCVFRIYK